MHRAMSCAASSTELCGLCVLGQVSAPHEASLLGSSRLANWLPPSPAGCLPPPCQLATAVLAAEIMSLAVELCFDELDAPPERITGVEVPMPYAANLEAASLPQIDDVVSVVKRMFNKQ